MTTKELIAFHTKDKYLSHAAYYYFKAEGNNESLLSALNRSYAGIARQHIVDAGLTVPSPSEVYQRAQTMFSPHQLHSFEGV